MAGQTRPDTPTRQDDPSPMAEQEVWTILKILNWTREFLAGKGIENARLEAEWLLAEVTGLDRVGLYLNFDRPLNPEELATYRAMISRRARREPLQHILGTQEFCGMEFLVTPDVLIPRHDTETLVEAAVASRPDAATVLDVGTGSGCIAVALAKQLPHAAVTAIDLSAAALGVAEGNAARNGAAVEFLQGSLFEPAGSRRFDLVVSNPPYIPTADIETLEPEVRLGEPRSALDGGPDGLAFYRRIIPLAPVHLTDGGWLLVEVGAGQAADVERLFMQTGEFEPPVSFADHGGIRRVVGAVYGRKEES